MFSQALNRSRTLLNSNTFSVFTRNALNLRDFSSSSSSSSSSRFIVPGVEESILRDKSVKKILSEDTASKSEKLRRNITDRIEDFRLHDTDTGSSGIQIAVMTERIQSLARHFATHKKDKHSMRGFQQIISRRRMMMKYLKNTDFDTFTKVVKKLGLEKEALQLS